MFHQVFFLNVFNFLCILVQYALSLSFILEDSQNQLNVITWTFFGLFYFPFFASLVCPFRFFWNYNLLSPKLKSYEIGSEAFKYLQSPIVILNYSILLLYTSSFVSLCLCKLEISTISLQFIISYLFLNLDICHLPLLCVQMNLIVCYVLLPPFQIIGCLPFFWHKLWPLILLKNCQNMKIF